MSLPVVPLIQSQSDFLLDVKTPFCAYLGGYRSGKTRALVLKSLYLQGLNKGYDSLFLEPTGSMVEGIAMPMFNEICDQLGWREGETYWMYRNAVNPRVVLDFNGTKSTIYFRSSENWDRIRGFTISHFCADEFDTSGFETCTQAWQKMVGRLTRGNNIQGNVASTKEGFQFCYNFFVQNAGVDRKVYECHVKDNPFVDDGYVERLKEQLSEKQFAAYVNNEWCNFNTGAVYYSYDRIKNGSEETLEKHPNAPLHIGVDFNVNKMCAETGIIFGGNIHMVDECFGQHNTLALAEELQKRYRGRQIKMYVDSAGQSEKTNASQTDIQILRQFFGEQNVFAYKRHILVADRVGVVNSKLCAADNKTRNLFINDRKAPLLAKSLETQSYDDKGKPDKANDVDHPVDALGYFVSAIFPPRNRLPTSTVIRG
jgi:hypothetical protein